jgi:hypothetical protein
MGNIQLRVMCVASVLLMGAVAASAQNTIIEYPITPPSSQSDGITSGPDGNRWFTESFANEIGSPALLAPPELYWARFVDPDGATGFPNMVWFDLDGIPGPPPVAANIPIPAAAWTPQGGPWWMDAVQAPGQPGLLFLLTTGYEGELRAFRTNGTTFAPCGSYAPSINAINNGVRVSPSGSFALVVQGSNPAIHGGLNQLLKFPVNLAVPVTVNTNCILPGAPTQIPVPSNTAIANVDFHPNTPAEVVVSGYSNIVTFIDPISGIDLCDVPVVDVNGTQLTRLEARYRPDGQEVWAASYDAKEIAVINPPSVLPPLIPCAVTTIITGFGPYDGLFGESFHPDPTVGVYYVTSYTGGRGSAQIYALDTTTKSITGAITLTGTAGMTAVTRGPTNYLLEVPIYGCCPQFGYTSTYDVSNRTKARDPGAYLIGQHASTVNMRNVATLRTVQP